MDPTPTHTPVLDLFSLKGQNALITGASRGIGYACALALAQAGANVCLVLRPPPNASAPAPAPVSTATATPPATPITTSTSTPSTTTAGTTDIVTALRTAFPSQHFPVVHADLADIDAVKRVVPAALEAFARIGGGGGEQEGEGGQGQGGGRGRIDVFVNCAGIQRRAPAEVFGEAEWDEVGGFSPF
ncbi:hypothetical protein JR316_0008868 [Psilocybe cubensis]|uniref:NAD(P)-binding protein n=2 Tax=Psilocybe cubensis TaxID=181762 RepID=A0A8H7XUC1_PSICU|nr:hypothetical protein JR316_0008868 [Psilocybe cubensis]KAH9478413.1 hypothetical protein JR316_0008868 [Psilocybe cubensis]